MYSHSDCWVVIDVPVPHEGLGVERHPPACGFDDAFPFPMRG